MAEQAVGPTAGCVHELFECQAARNPRATALVSDGRRVTYGALNARADRLADVLRATGLGRGHLAGVCLERGVDMVVALLAVLKTGAGYAMLDPNLPVERLRGMVADAGVSTVLHGSRRTFAARVVDGVRPPHGVRLVPVAQDRQAEHGAAAEPAPGSTSTPRERSRPEDPFCVMFTSGSTGRPKGVVAPHHALTATLTCADFGYLGPDSVWLQCAPMSWDAFALELWAPLLHGGTCVLHPGPRPDPLVMRRLVAEHGITDLYLSGSLFNVIVDEYPEALAGVRRLTAGGEVISPRHAAEALRRYAELRLAVGYGPVEGMIYLTTHPVTLDDTDGRPLPIGRCLEGKRIHLLDERLRPVPDGTVGELYASGAGLAHGYANRPGLTAERFVPDPYGPPGERMYRTGDLARRRADGVLEFAGRVDDQVKIRGFRVEPGEVEAVLARHPGIERAAVLARDGHDGERRLVAYVVPHATVRPAGAPQAPGAAQHDTWRRHAQDLLPDFMVPADFVTLDALPLTPNGKLDRAALPDPAPPRPAGAPPRTPEEKALCALFAEVLGRTDVGIHDSFFDLGGQSLRAARLRGRVRSAFGVELDLRTLFETPTVAGLAPLLTNRANETADEPDQPDPADGAQRTGPAGPARVATDASGTRTGVAPRPDILPLSAAQRALWFLDHIEAGAAYNVPLLAHIEGPVDADRLRAALAAVTDRHEALRTVFTEGPERTGEPVQRILQGPEARPRLTRRRVTAADLADAAAEAARHRFDLSGELLWHAVLFEVEDRPDTYGLLLVMHHIAVDGWSLAPLLADLSRAYAGEPLPPLPLQYADLALRQADRLAGRAALPGTPIDRQLDHWRRALRDLPAAPALPRRPDHPPVPGVGARAATLVRHLDADTHARLVALGRAHGATLFMVLHAALATVLDRAAPGADLAIGTPVAGRGPDGDGDEVVGFFVNLLVLRPGPVGDDTVAALLDRVRDCDLAALAHQDVPFEQVVDALNPPRLRGHHPFTDVVLALQNNVRAALRLPGADCRVEVVRTGAARFQLLVDVTDAYDEQGAPAGLTLTVEYQDAVFEAEVTTWLADALVDLLRVLPEQERTRAADLPLPEPPRRAAPQEPALPPGTGTPGATTQGGAAERRIAAVWAQVLGVDRVGPQDDFFALGGNSLRAVRAAARLTTAENLPVTTVQIFEHPTPAALAASLAGSPGAGPDAPSGPKGPEGGPITRRRRVPRNAPSKESDRTWN